MARTPKRRKKYVRRHLTGELRVRKQHQKIGRAKAAKREKEQLSLERSAAKALEGVIRIANGRREMICSGVAIRRHRPTICARRVHGLRMSSLGKIQAVGRRGEL